MARKNDSLINFSTQPRRAPRPLSPRDRCRCVGAPFAKGEFHRLSPLAPSVHKGEIEGVGEDEDGLRIRVRLISDGIVNETSGGTHAKTQVEKALGGET